MAGIFALSVSMSAFSNCEYAYREAANNRDERNAFIAGTGLTLATVGSIVTGAGILLIPAAMALPATHFTLEQVAEGGIYKNRIRKTFEALLSASENRPSKDLDKIINKGIKKAGLEYSLDLRQRSVELLAEGFDLQYFCPRIQVGDSGKEKTVVFSRKALVQYLSLKLSVEQ